MFVLFLKLFLGILNKLPFKIIILLLSFIAQLDSKLNLLIENLLHLLSLVLVLLLLLSLLLFVELLTKLLDLAPLVFTNIRRQVFDFDCFSIIILANSLITKLGRSLRMYLLRLRFILISHTLMEACHQRITLTHCVGSIFGRCGVLQRLLFDDLRIVHEGQVSDTRIILFERGRRLVHEGAWLAMHALPYLIIVRHAEILLVIALPVTVCVLFYDIFACYNLRAPVRIVQGI